MSIMTTIISMQVCISCGVDSVIKLIIITTTCDYILMLLLLLLCYLLYCNLYYRIIITTTLSLLEYRTYTLLLLLRWNNPPCLSSDRHYYVNIHWTISRYKTKYITICTRIDCSMLSNPKQGIAYYKEMFK